MTPALGLIVLRVDETIEEEFRAAVAAKEARLHITRIPSGDALTADTIGQMEANLTAAAALLPPAAEFDVVGYACTSGTAFLGSDNVTQRVKQGVPTRHVTNPLDAALAAMAHHGMARIGLVSPYEAPVSDVLVNAFEAAGITVAQRVSFEETDESRVVRIDPKVTAQAARDLAAQGGLDGIFLSCTNLKTASILGPLRQELNMPVLSSNQALAWHMRRLAGLPD